MRTSTPHRPSMLNKACLFSYLIRGFYRLTPLLTNHTIYARNLFSISCSGPAPILAFYPRAFHRFHKTRYKKYNFKNSNEHLN